MTAESVPLQFQPDAFTLVAFNYYTFFGRKKSSATESQTAANTAGGFGKAILRIEDEGAEFSPGTGSKILSWF